MRHFILFNSPLFFSPKEDNENYLSPLGLGYIATYLDKEGIDTHLVDCIKERLSVCDILRIIAQKKPTDVGFNIFTQNYHIVKYIVEHIATPCNCFIGGLATKSAYNDILGWETTGRLIVIIGEGELIIPKIVSNQCVEDPILYKNNNVVYSVNQSSVYFPKDISAIELNRKFFKNEVIINHYGEPEASIVTSRGCIYDCAFCGGARSLNSDVYPRSRSVDSITKEITGILKIYPNVASIRILDDLFLKSQADMDAAYSIFTQFENLNWRAMVHVLSFKNSCNIFKQLKESNCRELFMGIESGSEKIRKQINKLGSVLDIINVARSILEAGIDLKGYFMFGFPGETLQEFDATYKLAKKLVDISLATPGHFRSSVFQFRPYQGTKLYNEIIERTGKIDAIQPNNHISELIGRSQFNFSSGNYSNEPDEILYKYITATQNLTRN